MCVEGGPRGGSLQHLSSTRCCFGRAVRLRHRRYIDSAHVLTLRPGSRISLSDPELTPHGFSPHGLLSVVWDGASLSLIPL